MIAKIKLLYDCQIISLTLRQIAHQITPCDLGPCGLSLEAAMLCFDKRAADQLTLAFDVRNDCFGIFF